MASWTVAGVLSEIGWPLGNRGRTTCPICRSDNPTTFSYREEVWHCFRCGEKGGTLGLLHRFRPPLGGLRLTREQARQWLREPNPGPPAPSRRMAAAARAGRLAREEAWGQEHRAAHETLRRGQRLLSHELSHDCSWRWELGGALVVEAWGRLDAVDALLGCDCREERGLSRL